MNFNFIPEQQLLNFIQQQNAAIDQQRAQIFPDRMNPYAAPGGFVQGQLDFNQAFLNQNWQYAQQLAAIWPNDQPIPNIFSNNMGGQTAFDNYFEAILENSNKRDFANGEMAGSIGGYGTYFTPEGQMVFGVSHMPQFQYYDPIGGGTMGSNIPLTDPNLTPLMGWPTPSFF